MEIKILVKENEKAELDKFISICKEHGMQLAKEGGGRLPNFSGYYAELKGVRWQKDNIEEANIIVNSVDQTQSISKETGIFLIAKERQEQILKHGMTIEYDMEFNKNMELLWGARALLLEDCKESIFPSKWDIEICLKMAKKTYKERLIIAGALIAAEIDRMQIETCDFCDKPITNKALRTCDEHSINRRM